MPRKYRKPNWTRVEIGPTDERLIKTTGDEGFVRRDHAIKYIFEGKVSYAKIRIRKLKRFGYLKAVSEKKGDPESYLLGPEGVDIVRKFYPIGLRGWGCPSVLESIDPGSYEHSWKVTEIRLLFENMGFAKNWKSGRMLRAGTKGGQKVPDGFFIRNQKGIAIEVELKLKKEATYRKIFEVYERDAKTHYILYLCGSVRVMQKIMKWVKEGITSKKFCFILYDDLLRDGEEAVFVVAQGGWFRLKAILK